MPGYRYAMLPHPIANLTPDECCERAASIMRDPRDRGHGRSQEHSIADGSARVQRGLARDDARLAVDASSSSSTVLPTSAMAADDVVDDRSRRRRPDRRQRPRAHRAIEYYYEQGWTDGLPVVPPIAEKVDEFIDYVGRDRTEVVAVMAHLDRSARWSWRRSTRSWLAV